MSWSEGKTVFSQNESGYFMVVFTIRRAGCARGIFCLKYIRVPICMFIEKVLIRLGFERTFG